MKRRSLCTFGLLAPLGLAAAPALLSSLRAPVPDGRPHVFGFDRGQFVLDQQPWQLRSGEMHPLRIARADWLQRIRMAKAMGLNTIALYLMWNAYEREPGQFDFATDERDFVAFIKLCQQEGMWVYLRPGPYVCAEWTLGGLPPYLLREPGMRLRDANDARYMAAVQRYIAAVAPRLAPLMAGAGGPVLMLQIENEYSMHGSDVGYLQALAALWRQHGIDGPFSLAEGMKDLRRRKAYLPGAALGLDGADLQELQQARTIAGDAPVWVAEGYPGWLTHWGDADVARRDYAPMLQRLMAAGYSFNLYVVHGGSNFGLSAGANAEDDGSHFQPVLTSYDYSAPIDERGRATPAYTALRSIIAQHSSGPLPAIPAAPARARFDAVIAHPVASLWDNLGDRPVPTDQPADNQTLLRQNLGLVVYRRRIAAGTQLDLGQVHDYAAVHLDGREIGHVSRMRHAHLNSAAQLALPNAAAKERQLDVLVDSFGHINFGPALGDAKGLLGPVRLDGSELRGWQVHGVALDSDTAPTLRPLQSPATRPGLFFAADIALQTVGDVYLDMRQWRKGYLWLNGRLLGRYWNIGPQQCLFCPGAWLRKGNNAVLVLDLHQLQATAIHCADSLRAAHDAATTARSTHAAYSAC
ncbi:MULTISPECIES: beta-galactosidase [Xanthomonas]|uniref:beta-galactosidase n=1 Tax=Xanthomonas TaxID=338 RepID=UPI0006E62C34|nr:MULTISPECIES: beta-galactosidase [Xanthomonas]MBO9746727.1 beta-galactosidase [Xanthomonas phaseoli pv. dieffenbachiae]MBO9752592.1 beta-galactosidase [Xanthomonas phaseoli pv. dieffenbachiae]MBO9876705.1 beta-galactosidase [Xanthomonas sp. D-99]MBO9888060.1 beta-galactosidase [Xanthomonas sp. D-36-1]OQP78918.1 beta-galactosidase [Xanthomonas citri]